MLMYVPDAEHVISRYIILPQSSLRKITAENHPLDAGVELFPFIYCWSGKEVSISELNKCFPHLFLKS